jgi:hypothetical protein
MLQFPMNIHLALEPHDTLLIRLQEGTHETTISAYPARGGALVLRRTLASAIDEGYGECYWPAPTGGQYWIIFKRDAEVLELMIMWTRGGASSWEHVFRSTDAASWIADRLDSELARLELNVPAAPDEE